MKSVALWSAKDKKKKRTIKGYGSAANASNDWERQGPFDAYSFVILCRCPIQKLKGHKIF
jgi:hypothetical protein